VESEVKANAMGINLGNTINPENPIINPPIVKGSYEDLDKIVDSTNNTENNTALKDRASDIFSKTDTLCIPYLRKVFKNDTLKWENGVLSGVKIAESNNDFSKDDLKKLLSGEVAELSLDFGGKKHTISSCGTGFKFAYFMQCVNHMLLIEPNLTITPEGEVDENVAVLGSGVYKVNTDEANASYSSSTTKTKVVVSGRFN
jgi:hypothetical protein